MKTSYKKAIYIFIICHCIGLLCILFMLGLMAFFFDPLHIFTTATDKENALYSKDSRVQNAGYIRNFNFDSVIIGNSHMENLSHRKTAQYLPGIWFNLSMSGSTENERKLVLDKVLRSKKIKQVLLLLNGGYRANSTQGYEVLYDKNPFNDISIYLNDMYSKCFFNHMSNTVFRTKFDDDCFGQKLNIDEHNAWIYDTFHSSRLGGIEKWALHYQNEQLFDTYKALNKNYSISPRNLKLISKEIKNEIENNINKNVLSLVKAHPETQFFCYVHPIFKLGFAIDLRSENEDAQLTEVYIEYLRQVVKVASSYKNFKLYGFDNLEFTADVKNYKDLTHFTPKLNYQLLNYIKEDRYLLDNSNIDEYIDEFIKRCYAFDILSFHNELNKLIKENNKRKK